MCTQMFLHIITATLLTQMMAHCRKSKARIFLINGEGINQLKSCILQYFSGIITATLLAQLIVRVTFISGGL